MFDLPGQACYIQILSENKLIKMVYVKKKKIISLYKDWNQTNKHFELQILN